MTNKYSVNIEQLIGWDMAKRAALATINKMPKSAADEEWIGKAVKSEHSMCRVPTYWIELKDIPYFVAMHLVRHKHGVEWFCQTSREDRTGVSREMRGQCEPVTLCCLANAQAVINISKKRLCGKADEKTQDVWKAVMAKMKEVDPVLAHYMKPACFWQGGRCYEFESCAKKKRK